jgi:hypothetical protein
MTYFTATRIAQTNLEKSYPRAATAAIGSTRAT